MVTAPAARPSPILPPPISSVVAGFVGRSTAAETRRGQRRILGDFLLAIGRDTLAEITPADVIAYRASLLRLRTSTQWRVMSVVHAFLAWAVRNGYIAVNPARGLRLVRPGPARRRTIPLTTQAHVLQGGASERDAALVHLLVLTGCRIGELTAANVGDWDSVAQRLRLTGKTGSRLVPVPLPAATALDTHLAGRDPLPPDAPLIAGRQGRLSTRRAADIWRAACRAADFTPCGPHQARHAYAERLMARRVSPRVAAALLGHASVVTTLQMYGSVSWELLAEATADDPLA